MSSKDTYHGLAPAMVNTPRGAFPIVPSDHTDLPFVTTALWVGMPGNLTVLFAGAAAPVTFLNVPVGRFPGRFVRVLSATTATDLVGTY